MLTSRDIEAHYRNMGPERGSLFVLCTLAEQVATINQRFMELANMMARLSDLMVVDMKVRQKMMADLDALSGKQQHDVSADGADEPQGLIR